MEGGRLCKRRISQQEHKLSNESKRLLKEKHCSESEASVLHAVWFIRNTSKFPIRLFLIFSKNLHMTVAYLLLNFLLILAMLFLKKALY